MTLYYCNARVADIFTLYNSYISYIISMLLIIAYILQMSTLKSIATYIFYL